MHECGGEGWGGEGWDEGVRWWGESWMGGKGRVKDSECRMNY